MLHVVLWKWVQHKFRVTYTPEHVNIVSQMVRRNVQRQEVQVHCITDDDHGIWGPTKCHKLWEDFNDLPNATGRELPSCYRRLKLFDIPTQAKLGFKPGDRICSLDLDSIVLGPLDDIFERLDKNNASYGGWGVPGTFHQTVFNGSFWSFKSHDPTMQHVWSAFKPSESPRLALKANFLGSDQAWLSMCFTKDPRSMAIRFPDFASYPREIRRTNTVDRRTRIVFFHGARKPWHPEETRKHNWITKVWRTS